MASFKEAFAKARKELGAGKTFTWQGKSYTTNFATEDKPKEFSVDMAKSAINKAATKGQPMTSSPRPQARPVDKTPKGVTLAKASDIKTSKLESPKKAITTKVAGRGGYASGTAAGMPAKKKESTANYGNPVSNAAGNLGSKLGKTFADFTLGLADKKKKK